MEPKQSKENALFEWYDSLVFALAVIVLFFVFAVRIITVSGVSMQPTLYGGDRVAVQSMLYTPQRAPPGWPVLLQARPGCCAAGWKRCWRRRSARRGNLRLWRCARRRLFWRRA